MSLGHVYEFTKVTFDFDRFFEKKACEVVEISYLDEYKKDASGKSEKTGNYLGCRIKVCILVDETPYKLRQGEFQFSNRLKEISFKLLGVMPADSPVKIGDKVAGKAFLDQGGFFLPKVEDCTAYSSNRSNFYNEISVTVSGFQKIEKKK